MGLIGPICPTVPAGSAPKVSPVVTRIWLAYDETVKALSLLANYRAEIDLTGKALKGHKRLLLIGRQTPPHRLWPSNEYVPLAACN